MTFDFFDTLVFHKEGRGRGRVLMEYLQDVGLRPAAWEHSVLYDVFAAHGGRSSPWSENLKGDYRGELSVRVFERLGIEAPEEDAHKHADALWEILGPAAFEVFPEVLETLAALRTRGMPLAIVSNWQSGLSHFCVDLGLADFFDHVLASAELGVEKPEAQIFHEACRRLESAPDRTLHVGDTYVDDYEGGEAAGLQVVLIDRADRTAPEAARVIRSLEEVERLIGD